NFYPCCLTARHPITKALRSRRRFPKTAAGITTFVSGPRERARLASAGVLPTSRRHGAVRQKVQSELAATEAEKQEVRARCFLRCTPRGSFAPPLRTALGFARRIGDGPQVPPKFRPGDWAEGSAFRDWEAPNRGSSFELVTGSKNPGDDRQAPDHEHE